jgi:hypothetical protein
MSIFKWIAEKTVGRFDRALRAQADDVREIARRFRLSIFPEILRSTQGCSICKKPQLLLIHPDLICYSCLTDAIREAHGSIR